MPRVAVLHHLDPPFTGFAGVALRAADVELDERNLPAGDALPRLDEVDGLLTLGGRQSARELDRYDYLRAEAALLRDAVDAGVPVFGACLGGQLTQRVPAAVQPVTGPQQLQRFVNQSVVAQRGGQQRT